ncbi:unnamed protein product [Protopolystoma xenopodis]|uniref:Uncharacterized protein n=1 Tax=Protopolystoma xenopodis TaxID=117903 RepID=A0A448XG25_9PLAT|nr:unnamed protein product [Protopolystoma xenopodis]
MLEYNEKCDDSSDNSIGNDSEYTQAPTMKPVFIKSACQPSEPVESDLDIEKGMKTLALLTQRSEELQRMAEVIGLAKKEIRGQIEQNMQMINQALYKRREYLLNELDLLIGARCDAIGKMQFEFESLIQRLGSLIEIYRRQQNERNLEFNGEKPIQGTARGKKMCAAELERLIEGFVPLHPAETDTLSFFPTELDQLLGIIKRFGSIGLTSISVEHSTLEEPKDLTGSFVQRCSTKETVKIPVILHDSMGRKIQNPDEAGISASLTLRIEHPYNIKMSSELEEIKNPFNSEAKLNENQDRRLNVVYRINYPGIYDLNVKVFGEDIKGSPYTVLAKSTLGPNAIEWMECMTHLSRSQNRRRVKHKFRKGYVSSPTPHQSPERPPALADQDMGDKGDFLFSCGTKGRLDGEFANPQGICFTRNSKIVVVDSNNSNIQVSVALINRVLF